MNVQKINKWMTISWCMVLFVFALHCTLCSRESFSLTKRLGPQLPSTVPQSFRFAVFSDSHSCRTSLRDILQKASTRCDFAIHLGDFVEFDDDYEYRYFVTRIDDIVERLPLYLVRGNHETMSATGGFSQNFLRYVPQPYYSFQFGNSLFFIMDNALGKIDYRQRKSLDHTLKEFRDKNRDRPIFLLMHIAPFDLDLSDRSYLEELVNKYNVSFLFAGDTHTYLEKPFAKAKMIVTGCGGGSIHNPSTEVHYVEVSVTPEGVATEKISAYRDSMWWVAVTYMLFVAVPRYRWYFFCGSFVLLLWEFWRFRCSVKKEKV